MSPRAKAFVEANALSPVVSGSAIEPDPRKPAKGCRYKLKSGQSFRLSAADCKDIGAPKWDFSNGQR